METVDLSSIAKTWTGNERGMYARIIRSLSPGKAVILSLSETKAKHIHSLRASLSVESRRIGIPVCTAMQGDDKLAVYLKDQNGNATAREVAKEIER